MRYAAIAVVLSALAVAGPAAAESSKTLQSALVTCLQNYKDFKGAMKAFKAAGFSYQTEDFGGGPTDVLHHYASPDGAVRIQIAFGNAHDGNSCRVASDRMNVSQALPFARSVAEAVFKTPFASDSPSGGKIVTPSTPGASQDYCTGYQQKISGRIIHVTVGGEGQDPLCVDDVPMQIDVNVKKG